MSLTTESDDDPSHWQVSHGPRPGAGTIFNEPWLLLSIAPGAGRVRAAGLGAEPGTGRLGAAGRHASGPSPSPAAGAGTTRNAAASLPGGSEPGVTVDRQWSRQRSLPPAPEPRGVTRTPCYCPSRPPLAIMMARPPPNAAAASLRPATAATVTVAAAPALESSRCHRDMRPGGPGSHGYPARRRRSRRPGLHHDSLRVTGSWCRGGGQAWAQAGPRRPTRRADGRSQSSDCQDHRVEGGSIV